MYIQRIDLHRHLFLLSNLSRAHEGYRQVPSPHQYISCFTSKIYLYDLRYLLNNKCLGAHSLCAVSKANSKCLRSIGVLLSCGSRRGFLLYGTGRWRLLNDKGGLKIKNDARIYPSGREPSRPHNCTLTRYIPASFRRWSHE